MLTLTSHQMDAIAAAHQYQMEPAWIFQKLRDTYGSLLADLSDEFLSREISACLRCCDALGLKSNADRLSFCFLEIVGFPGFRDAPNLPAIIARCRETAADANALVAELRRLAPPAFWLGLNERCAPERRRRGMPE